MGVVEAIYKGWVGYLMVHISVEHIIHGLATWYTTTIKSVHDVVGEIFCDKLLLEVIIKLVMYFVVNQGIEKLY